MSLEKLEAYRHDIAECHESLYYIVQDASEAFQNYDLVSTPNLVRQTRAVIDHCLESEERATEFLRIVQTNNKDLYESMEKHGAKGPPGTITQRTKATHTLTDDVQSALGSGLDRVSKAIADYSFLTKVTEILPAVDHMFAERVILTEEYEDFYML